MKSRWCLTLTDSRVLTKERGFLHLRPDNDARADEKRMAWAIGDIIEVAPLSDGILIAGLSIYTIELSKLRLLPSTGVGL